MKYSVKKERLIEDLMRLEEENNALNDYGLLVRHLLNEVDELKQLLIQRVKLIEEVLRYETCEKGKEIMCRCKNNQDCKELSEMPSCPNCGSEHQIPYFGFFKCTDCHMRHG